MGDTQTAEGSAGLPGRARLLPAAAGFLAGAAAVAAFVAGAQHFAGSFPLAAAVAAAEAAGRYSFEATSAVTAGQSHRSASLTGEGEALGSLDLLSVSGADTTYSIDWPAVTLGGETIPRESLAALLPAGDPLGLVASGHAAAAGAVEPIGPEGRLCRRVDFLVAGRAYSAWWSTRPEAVPVNADAGGLPTFNARAVLWFDPVTDLPCRVYAVLDLPRLLGEQPGQAVVDWLYVEWLVSD